MATHLHDPDVRAGCPACRSKPSRKLAAGVGLFLALLTVPAATADAMPPGTGQPDEADLRLYLDCSRIAEGRLLGFEEAYFCSRVFLKIKLSFVPGMTVEVFDQLSPQEKTAVNSVGYLRYRDWVQANAAWPKTLKSPTPPSTTLSGE